MFFKKAPEEQVGPGLEEQSQKVKREKVKLAPAEQVGPGWEEQSRRGSGGVTLPRVMLVVLLLS